MRVAINGFGRIGRMVFRAGHNDPDIDFVVVNDLSSTETLAHLLKYDSVHGRFPGEIAYTETSLIINGKELKVVGERDPENLPWKDMDIDVVVECTGIFRTKEGLEKHRKAGAKKVLLSAPAKDKVPTFVKGVNDDKYKGEDVISNASCTTNCLAPMVKILHENFGVEKGLMTTVHGYTADQRIVDGSHKDLRRARAAATNIVPTTTGAAIAVGKVIPELNGKLNGMAVRVPIPDGSLTDLTAVLKREPSVEGVNKAFKKAADGPLKGLLKYEEDPLVSSDIVGDAHSCIFDSLSTTIIGNTVKIVGWYDNEWGYSSRMIDMIKLLGK